MINIQLNNAYVKGTHILLRMYGVTIQMIDADVCIPPEDHPEIGSKHVLGKNKPY
jgi:hypothetical protein